MSLESLSALVFDAYGTLFDLRSAVPACEALFPGKGANLNRLWRAKQLRQTRRCVLTRRYTNLWEIMDGALERACFDLGLRSTAAERESLRQQYLTLRTFPEVPATLERLEEHYALLLLSHGTQPMLDAVAEHNGITRHFRAVRSVDAVRAYKPDPRAYAIAEETLGVPHAAIGFVSTNPFDIAGAKAYGLRTVWLHRETSSSRIMGLLADISVENLAELARVLGA
jgi:2-haloacid dehalogenase